MYWNDLSEDQKTRIWEMLRSDPVLFTPNLNADEQDQEIDDWINRNNDTDTILALLKKAYKA